MQRQDRLLDTVRTRLLAPLRKLGERVAQTLRDTYDAQFLRYRAHCDECKQFGPAAASREEAERLAREDGWILYEESLEELCPACWMKASPEKPPQAHPADRMTEARLFLEANAQRLQVHHTTQGEWTLLEFSTKEGHPPFTQAERELIAWYVTAPGTPNESDEKSTWVSVHANNFEVPVTLLAAAGLKHEWKRPTPRFRFRQEP